MTISEKLRQLVVARHLDGGKTIELAQEFRLSVGSVHNFVNEERRIVPDYDELRRLNIRLKKSNMTVDEAEKGIEFRETLRSYGLGEKDLGDYFSLVESLQSENGLGPDFIGYSVRFKKLSEDNGMTYEEFINDCERKNQEAIRARETTEREKAEYKEYRAKNKEAELA